jgi:transcriptional regulator with XRE-family HTH domain
MVVMAVMTKDDPRPKFGLEVRRRREALGLTLEQLSIRCGMTPNYIGTIENGHRDPSLSSIEALARGLGITTGELLGPVPKLSGAALEMAKLFEQSIPDVQAAVLLLLYGLITKPRR